MKIIRGYLLILFCTFAMSARAIPIVLSAGETFTYEFDSLPFTQVQTYFEGTARPEGSLFWNAVSLRRGTLLEVKLFEDSVSDAPLIEHIWSSTINLGGGFTLYPPAFPNVWQDLQGAFSMTVLSGAAAISSIEISSFIPIDSTHANLHRRYLAVVSEPGSSSLFLIAALGLLFAQARKKQH